MWDKLISPITGLLSEFIEDKDKVNEIAFKIQSQVHEIAKGQMEVNKAEAGHRSIFVAGWRPFIGWTCGAALAWHFILSPFVLFIAAISGAVLPVLPVFDMSSLMSVLMGMLGLGGLRTFEKIKGKAK